MPHECNFSLLPVFPPSFSCSERTRGTASSRQPQKERRGGRKRDCDGGIKGYPSPSVTSFIVPAPSCRPIRHPLSHGHTTLHNNKHQSRAHTRSPPCFTHSQQRSLSHTFRGGNGGENRAAARKATQTRPLRPVSHIQRR